MAARRELLIGCGNRQIKHLSAPGYEQWQDLTTLDHDAACKPDVVWDLNQLPLPFEDESFDEIHAYEVLEHTGSQGNYRFFFAQFSDLWRLLRPDGFLLASVPRADSIWAWGDPSHTRVITKEQLMFLDQQSYDRYVGMSPMTDFRSLYKADFRPYYLENGPESFFFVLQAVKPSRIDPARA